MSLLNSFCELNSISQVTELEFGMDFRRPEYRREVFLRFYEFHCKYKSHPGAVYYVIPYLEEKNSLIKEELYWLCYLNGICQNIITSWEIFSNFPDFKNLKIDILSSWFRDNYKKFGWDTDRKYVKNSFEKCVYNYKKLIGGKTQQEYFEDICNSNSSNENFDKLWEVVTNKFYLFGRLSSFSYLEYLKISGLNINCSNLFIYDIEGSKSHRNGLCKILGRDDLDLHPVLNPEFKGYSKEQLNWLEKEGEILLEEAKSRVKESDYFTLESTLCCYKSWFRKNRRYPNVYNDMFYNRILFNEKSFCRRNNIFRDIRKSCLPIELRLEDNPNDPGLVPEKQNWFRNTGEVIMMDIDWPCFKNNFNKTHQQILF